MSSVILSCTASLPNAVGVQLMTLDIVPEGMGIVPESTLVRGSLYICMVQTRFSTWTVVYCMLSSPYADACAF